MPKPPLLMLVEHPELFGLEHVGDLYDLRHAPAPGIEAALSSGNGVDAAMLAAAPDLKMIALSVVGYDKVDVAGARARGIVISNTPDVLTDDVADLALGLMIAVARRLPAHDRFVREGRWPQEGPPALTRRASGRRVGVLGLGRIGQAIAARAQPFAAAVGYYSRRPRDEGATYHYCDTPLALARWADVLIVAVAGGAKTAGLVSREVIEALGPDGMLINIARGSVVEEPALVAALSDGRLGAAGLDVFAHEPNVPEALLAMDNVVLVPHQGSATRETRAAMGQLALDNLAAFFAGEPLLTPI
ncbi:2-hydroxyacid dehydrogenase [Sphingomonas crusticola]|uniref:2-hydroxyacid dehydrogenase n=1 Tax=Sphingomonas crusticola TaxID=1697973 RepID=UPI000E252821|nr:2-hydroxyacid dehydrogenase [Sphingomonas crusticola]